MLAIPAFGIQSLGFRPVRRIVFRFFGYLRFRALLGGSWVVISFLIRVIILVIVRGTLLIAPL